MAKKAKSTLLNMFLSLTVIALVAAFALASLNKATEEPIEKAKKAKIESAIKEVLKQEDAEIAFDRTADTVIYFGERNEKGSYKDSAVCHIAYANDEMAGMAIEVADFNAFGGTLKTMVGLDAEGKIYGYQIIETHETPGLGAKADTWFQAGGKGDIINRHGSENLKVKKDQGDVDAISGSTITSRAFLRTINKAYESFEKINK
ncbi:MAG: RnfABCDGE type electron transport complex subunit G [Bacteroidales bacterium]|nr:RnfABCDGE type electron transport complex subunit G [Bacteroidales bacterium]